MHSARKVTAIAGIALSALVLAGLLLVPSSAARAGPPEPRELPALREAPNIPVGSIFLRRAFPNHPLPPPLEQEFPGPDVPGREGRPGPGGGGCDKDVDLTSKISGVVAVAAQDNVICTNADIDTYVDAMTGNNTYVVQAGGEEAAWTLTDVNDPSNPAMVGQWFWTGRAGKNTYTPDIKTFSQGDQDFIVMGLERMKVRAFCGVVIYNVTDPANPEFESQFIGSDWCDTHNVFVEKDNVTGDGKYIYATADGPNDLRVLDISSTHVHTTPPPDVVDCTGCVANPVEIGRYTAPTANNDNYVHDVTVLYRSLLDTGADDGRRVYLSYWDSGLIILKAADVTPGTSAAPVVAPIDPLGFLTHHAWASEDGSSVFLEDEFLDTEGDEPVQMWDVSSGTPTHVDSLVLGTDVPVNPAHNLEIRYDIDPNRLYVAWYKLGLRAWDFDSAGFLPAVSPAPPAVFHQAQTEAADQAYSGAWGVRLEIITVGLTNFLYIFQSDRSFGLIVDCEGCAAPTTGTVTGTVTDSSDGSAISGASVVSATGESDITDTNGDYTLSNVPTGTQTVTASATGFVTQQNTNVVVTDGGTTVVDFALDPVPAAFGTIKGRVTDASTGAKVGGVLVMTDTGESATNNNGGRYNIGNVPEGNRTVTASKSGYVTQQQPATVTAGQTTTANFKLVPQ